MWILLITFWVCGFIGLLALFKSGKIADQRIKFMMEQQTDPDFCGSTCREIQ
jgi:hypothetical protein